MALEDIKFSIPEILKTIGNKDGVLDKNEVDLFTAECRKYKNLSNSEMQSIFDIVQKAMSDENKYPTELTILSQINGKFPTV